MEPDVLPNALAVPVTLNGIDTTERAAYVEWLLEDFDVTPAIATPTLPEQLLGLLVATPEGWAGRVWTGATLLQKQHLLDQLCAHGALGDLRGEEGDWWWFPLEPTPFQVTMPRPEDRVQARLAQQLLQDHDVMGMLAEPELTQLQTFTQKHGLDLTAVLRTAGQSWEQPLWLLDGNTTWANATAQRLGWTPEFRLGTFSTEQGTFLGQGFVGVKIIRSRPSPGLRTITSQRLEDLLPAVQGLDWITDNFDGSILETLLPHLGRIQARVVLCLESPSDLEGFFSNLARTLDTPDRFDPQALRRARREGQLNIRLGVGLSNRYQIALLTDTLGDAMYYYSAIDQPTRTLGSWQNSIEEFQKKFEALWQTTGDNRIQVIDLNDLLESYGY